MKTAEQKAKEYADTVEPELVPDEIVTYTVGDRHEFAKTDFLAGYKEGQLNPHIKNLEWEKYRDVRSKGRIWITVDGETAKTNIGSYELFEQDGKFLLYTIVGCLFEFETKELAKEFAQKDFEQMVMGCIETE